jgi:hypothetical protein
MDQKILQAREAAERLNEILGNSVPYKIMVGDPRALKLLEKNARYMTHDMFQNLVANIKRDGALSSLPLIWKRPDGIEIVLSGNHRVDAAIHAGLEFILYLYIDKDLSRSEQVAIQLSHNSIEGKDDMVILRELWQDIEDISLKYYAGLDSETIGEIDKLSIQTLSDIKPQFEQVIVQFLPEETESLRSILHDVSGIFSRDKNFIASLTHYDAVFSLLADIKEKYNIISNPVALSKVVELARERLDTLINEEKIIFQPQKQAESN